MPEYILILLFIFVVTLLLHRYFKVKLYKSLNHLIVFNFINIFLAIPWDQYAIARGHWNFNEAFLLGFKIGYMPIEEFLFVPVLAYFALTLYKILEKILTPNT